MPHLSTNLTRTVLTLYLICNLGCMEVTDIKDLSASDKSDTSTREEAHQLTEENNSQCILEDLKCQQQCFYDHGQTFGTLSPFYNTCMSRCEETLERCLQDVNVISSVETDEISYSWEQPPSEGIGGYYGYCGPTAAANLVTNICGHRITPRVFADESFGLGPGSHPNQLTYALNELGCCGVWSVCQHDPAEVDVFQELQKSLPAAVMLNWSQRSMHWVTVMRVKYAPRCEVVYNHWGGQATMGCNEFLERWSLAESTLGKTALASRLVQPFTYVCQVNSEPQQWGACE